MDGDPRSPICLAPHFKFLDIDSSKGEIRVLRIHPGPPDSPIECTYEITTVSGPLPYHTLSYVWGRGRGHGAGGETKAIHVDGTRVELTENVFAALTQIRSATTPRHLWVDALCINQHDGREKTAQVHMMHAIYRNCVECLMWMGEIDPEAINGVENAEEAMNAARAALDAVRVFAGENNNSCGHDRNQNQNDDDDDDDDDKAVSVSVPETLATEHQRSRAGHALHALLHNPWWSRIWTVQEATSPRRARVLWGPLSIPWALLTGAAERLIRGHYHHSPFSRLLQPGDVFPGDGNFSFLTAPILGLVWAARWIERPHAPLEMLWRFRYRDSTDPRDKVYVILNLVREDVVPLPSVRVSDYAIEPAVLFTRVMLDLIRSEHGLRPLVGLRGEAKSVRGLPSWVVDWSLPKGPGKHVNISAFWEHDKFWGQYTADRGLPMVDEDRLTGHGFGQEVLNLNGVFFEKVLVCGEVIERGESDERLSEMVDEVITTALVERPMFGVVAEVYWRQALSNIVEGRYGNPHDVFEGSTGDVFWRNEMLRYQRLFITENGAVGLGPSGAAAGDEVWIMSGGRSPFLFCPFKYEGVNGLGKDDEASYHYTFRGDVFIPGIMSGEAVDSRIDNQQFIHIH